MNRASSKRTSLGLAKLMRCLPNLITIVRFLLVLPAGWLLWQGAVLAALILIAVAGISDAIDGGLARRFDWHTRFGAIADPAADKLLVLVVLAVLAIQGHLPLWLLAIVVGRDLVIVSGALAYRQIFGNLEVEPTLLSKVNTGLQIAMLLLVLVGLTDFDAVAAVAVALVDPTGFALVGASGILSGTHYVIIWSRRAQLGFRDRREAAERRLRGSCLDARKGSE